MNEPASTKISPRALVIDTHQGIGELDAQAWDRLVGPQGSPFLEYGFLDALERTGCLEPESGWLPYVLTARWEGDPEDALIGALPFYIKTNSAGEFVYDWSWADAAYSAGVQYYPKAVVAVPFTPVTGTRLLIAPDLDAPQAVRAALVRAAIRLSDQLDLSGVHFNFILPSEVALFEEIGLPIRYGTQYHWYNGAIEDDGSLGEPYADLDDWLAGFRSKKRANIRRERRKLEASGVRTRVYRGEAIDGELMDRVYRYYKSTIDKFYWGRQYLSREFFDAIATSLPERLHIVVAAQDGDEFAGAFNLHKGDRLYGRYWGCRREVEFAHFEVCMYTAIDWCIREGVRVFEPGQGGEHKFDRGFLPTKTYSAHYIRDHRFRAAIEDFLEREAHHADRRIEAMMDSSPLKCTNLPPRGGR